MVVIHSSPAADMVSMCFHRRAMEDAREARQTDKGSLPPLEPPSAAIPRSDLPLSMMPSSSFLFSAEGGEYSDGPTSTCWLSTSTHRGALVATGLSSTLVGSKLSKSAMTIGGRNRWN